MSEISLHIAIVALSICRYSMAIICKCTDFLYCDFALKEVDYKKSA